MRQRLTSLLAVFVFSGLLLAPGVSRADPGLETRPDTTPIVLAYYYLRFHEEYWSAKWQHIPLLGPYSSDDLQVMERHAEWAQAAGIDGFIVSWKSTESLKP